LSDSPVNIIGVAGCGNMGLSMAENLLANGYDVWGYDIRSINASDDFQNRMISNARTFASKVNTVISVVRDIAETNALLFDDQAIMCSPNYPTSLIISSTLSPRFIHDLKDRIPDDVVLIDAPMSGTSYRAKLATLTFMVGGEADHVQRLMPILGVMGSDIHHLGPVGAGAACKVANNLCAAAGMVAVRRALAAAKGYGIPQDKLLDVMRTSSGSTWYGDNFTDIDWAREGYAPTNTMGIVEKDVKSFVDALEGLAAIESGALEDTIIKEIRKLEPLI